MSNKQVPVPPSSSFFWGGGESSRTGFIIMTFDALTSFFMNRTKLYKTSINEVRFISKNSTLTVLYQETPHKTYSSW